MSTTLQAERRYLPQALVVDDWASVSSYFTELLDRPLSSKEALQRWLLDLSELEAALSEEGGWRYIRMTLDTRDAAASKRYEDFTSEVLPPVETWTDKLQRKLMASPFTEQLSGEGYPVYLRGIREQLRIFREANVPIQAELRNMAQEYGTTIGAMSVLWEGKEITLPKAAAILEDTDRAKREQAYRLIAARRAQDRDKLDALFDRMVERRHTIALNSGFANYRDHMYSAMGRFDHSPADARAFHAAVEAEVVPLVSELQQERQRSLRLGTLRPWDLAVDTTGLPPLKPFNEPQQLIDLTIDVFGRLDPYFEDCIRTMQANGRLDLASRDGKAPGGYNHPLYESGAPFIFMNAVGTTDDVTTMLHEGGHAVHSFLTHPLPITGFKSFPSEVAELASMSMELLTMEHWDRIYPDSAECQRAKREQLERVITILPWVATVDAFQHWLYENPGHSHAERTEAWIATHQRFSGNVVDWSGLENERAMLWQKQLHVFEVPFYYIEYGIAQLGAIGIWRNAKRDAARAVDQYINALKLGYTRPLPDIYAAAGVPFSMRADHVRELMAAVGAELETLRTA
jgi:oligoendopeptidase F